MGFQNKLKKKYILHSSGLFTIAVIPFFVNFPELVLEVTEHIDFTKWVVNDGDGNMIIDLNKEGIEKAMGWYKRGFILS